jgi:hypothetical protein
VAKDKGKIYYRNINLIRTKYCLKNMSPSLILCMYNYKRRGKIKNTEIFLWVLSRLLVSNDVAEIQITEACFKLGPNEVRYLVNKNQGEVNWNAFKAQQIITLQKI